MSEPARFERAVAVIAGLVLTGAAAVMVRSDRDWQFELLLSPPFLTGVAAVGLAAARSPRTQRTWAIVIEQVVVLAMTLWGAIGLLFVLPAIIAGALASAFLGVVRSGGEATRPARTLVAIGALWTLVFGLVVFLGHGAPLCVRVALAASLALGLAGLAWLRAIEQAHTGPVLMPRAVLRP
jgi:hypothetical protein